MRASLPLSRPPSQMRLRIGPAGGCSAGGRHRRAYNSAQSVGLGLGLAVRQLARAPCQTRVWTGSSGGSSAGRTMLRRLGPSHTANTLLCVIHTAECEPAGGSGDTAATPHSTADGPQILASGVAGIMRSSQYCTQPANGCADLASQSRRGCRKGGVRAAAPQTAG